MNEGRGVEVYHNSGRYVLCEINEDVISSVAIHKESVSKQVCEDKKEEKEEEEVVVELEDRSNNPICEERAHGGMMRRPERAGANTVRKKVRTCTTPKS